jgi:hypothetical protein
MDKPTDSQFKSMFEAQFSGQDLPKDAKDWCLKAFASGYLVCLRLRGCEALQDACRKDKDVLQEIAKVDAEIIKEMEALNPSCPSHDAKMPFHG